MPEGQPSPEGRERPKPSRTVWLVYKDGKTRPLPMRKRPHAAHNPSRRVKRPYKRTRRPTKADMRARDTVLVVAAVGLLLIFQALT